MNRSEPLPTLHLALWWAVLSLVINSLMNRSEPLPTLHLWWAVLSLVINSLMNRSEPLPTLPLALWWAVDSTGLWPA
ncbi:MAG: hypothetical protein F6J90_14550 [Moorea sp. SIOASIH]|uniref:hypothetical protein n=1 Tax=Moorena sp. SIOASIH TaxID=2607817 RepID=UPI0013BA76C2|nr:hypothetical protein [Moorena sp. SIOASIH]NEO37478.1 hypothetical protein [Moorena sp. SIOASIH]